ncbi:hypothetical protein [Pseudomonas asplenii]|uniref:nSTAND3 domain-containing NTPase n=1 Tax=Pseudomonas asplenii TaxID=53407 RepID=UPI000369117C|nr:hypothetical protein [Pseudomonas fuscovaginae]
MSTGKKTAKATASGRAAATSNASSSVGAVAALAGYDYQLNVSVLAALRLLLITKSATSLTLEPANEEDLEADLEPFEPSPVVPKASLATGYKLVMQVKFCSGEPWSLADFENLLNYGKRRRPAKHHLDDPDTHFLLVTNADAKGVVRDLLVSGFEEKPDPAAFPRLLLQTLTKKPEGRVAIWGGLTDQLLELTIKEILSALLRVPHTRLTACREKLRAESLRRMRGSGPGVWTRDELLAIVREHGGFLASSAELEAFVEPSNFEAMLSRLRERGAIVITGPSGAGKTLAALALCERARLAEPGLDVVTVNPADGPAVTRRLMGASPTLFYLEDPWGQYSLRPGSESWTEQLPKLLRGAHPSNQYVITSRADVMGDADADEGLKRWSVELNADHYSEGQLANIYEKRMAAIATSLQPKALAFKREVLETLQTPLELDLFFTNLSEGPEPNESDYLFMHRLLGLAHRDAVEGVVVKYLKAIDQVGLSAVIWGLLVARGHFDREQLSAVARRLRHINASLGEPLEGAVERMVAARHLRQPNRKVTFSHPSVRSGFASFLEKNWYSIEKVFNVLLSALVSLTGDQRDWGLETAARVLSKALSFSAALSDRYEAFKVDETSRSEIDRWLSESLLDPRSEFVPLLELAADTGSAESIPSEIARWITKGRRRGKSFFIDGWTPPTFSDQWYDRVSADSRSSVIVNRFIREQLAQDFGEYSRHFVPQLDRIAPGLAPAFIEVAHKIVGTPFHSNARVIAAGAIGDLSGYEAVLVEALAELDSLHLSNQRNAEEWRAIEDGEHDIAYEEWHASHPDDEGEASLILVATYVSTKRSSGCWQNLANHPHAKSLVNEWARNIQDSRLQSSEEELLSILSIALGSKSEDSAWRAAYKHWHPSLEKPLLDRLLSLPEDQHLRDSLMLCAYTVAPTVLVECLKALIRSPADFIHLLVDLSVVAKKQKGRLLDLRVLSPEATEILNALYVTDVPQSLSSPALSLLELAASTCSVTVLAHIVPIIIACGDVPTGTIERWLAESTEAASALAATKAAIAINSEPLVWCALNHRRADAREAAFEYLAPRLPDPLPPQLLNLKSDPGSRVRLALVNVLSSRPHVEHLSVLLELSKDHWSDAPSPYDEPASYGIAREAVIALMAYGQLSDEHGRQLIELARPTEDLGLRRIALTVAASMCGADIRQQIWAVVEDENLESWARASAVEALALAPIVETDILNKVTPERLMSGSATLAASLTALVSKHFSVDDVVTVFEQVGKSQAHRALLLLGAYELESRDRAVALRLLDLLDVGHPARKLLDGDGPLLPINVLDDLGDVRIRRRVGEWLKDRIEKN